MIADSLELTTMLDEDFQIMEFTTPLPPSVNEYLGKCVKYNPITRKPYVHVYETNEAKCYKKLVAKRIHSATKTYEWTPSGEYEYVVCELDVYLSQKKRDSDNIFKCLLDAIKETKIVYDDCMIIPRVNNVVIDKTSPRVEVTLFKSSKKGLFSNEHDHAKFVINNCSSCTRAKRNCSIMKNTLENRITEELDVHAKTCSAYKKVKSNE